MLPDIGRPLNIAHRGASRIAPQNTLTAFRRALEIGADGIEFDVRLCADGVPVVIHDATVDATTDGSGRVAEMTLTQLKQLDAGAWFDPAFAGERIPTLEEVLEIFGDDLLLNIELKTTSPRGDGLEPATVALVQRYGLSHCVLLSSFNPVSLLRVKRVAPQIRVGLLYSPNSPPLLQARWLVRFVPQDVRQPQHSLVDARHVEQVRRLGCRIITWSVADSERIRRLIALGVDGIITPVPDIVGSSSEDGGFSVSRDPISR